MHKIHVVLSVKLALIIFNHQKSKRVPEKHLLYWLCQSLWLCKLSHFSRVRLTLCNPIDGSPPGSPVPGIFQARTLEWVAISFSSAWKWKVKGKSLSHVRPSVTPWTAAFQAPPSMGFSRQESWSGVPLPSPWITTNWKIHQEMGISDYLTCLLRNLYAGQEATVRTVPGTTDWFQIRKGVHQGCILSPCLFNLYAEYIMRNARLDEA